MIEVYRRFRGACSKQEDIHLHTRRRENLKSHQHLFSFQELPIRTSVQYFYETLSQFPLSRQMAGHGPLLFAVWNSASWGVDIASFTELWNNLGAAIGFVGVLKFRAPNECVLFWIFSWFSLLIPSECRDKIVINPRPYFPHSWCRINLVSNMGPRNSHFCC
jgi:hypothetical protein